MNLRFWGRKPEPDLGWARTGMTYQEYMAKARAEWRRSPWYAIGWMYGSGLNIDSVPPHFYEHTEFQLGYIEALERPVS